MLSSCARHLHRFTNYSTLECRFFYSSKTHLRQLSQQRKHLSFLLQKLPLSRHVTQQVHCYAIVSELLYHVPDSTQLLLFNDLLRCYSSGEFPIEAFFLYKHVQCMASIPYDSYTYSCLLNTSVGFESTVAGIQLHGLSLKAGFEYHVYVQTALVRLYSVHGVLNEATKVFDEMPVRNSVTWNVLIMGLMTWGHLDLAYSLFKSMPARTIVSWTAMIDGYTRMNRVAEAFSLFRRMTAEDGIIPSEITILTIIPAVSNLKDLKICKSVHSYGQKRGFFAFDIRVLNSLIDGYSKCGCILSSWKIFEEIPIWRKNLVSWTSIISSLAMHGKGKEAVESFKRLQAAKMKPNRVTFLSVLNACSHGGLVEEGLRFFDQMIADYRIEPDIKHYGSLIDMLGRAGRLEEAEKIALEVPADIANDIIWRTLLGACSFHGNVKMAERVAKKILEIEREYGGDYVLMSNIFTGVGRYVDAERLRDLMDQNHASKVTGHSLI